MEQETLNEVALEFAKDHHEMYETSNLGSMHFGFCWGVKWQREQDNTANEILDYILTNDDGVGIALGYNSREMIEQYFKRINYGK